MIRRLLSLTLMLGLAVCAFAHDEAIEGMIEKVQNNRVSFDYSYTVSSADAPLLFKGSVLMQQECFYAVGSGLRIFSDGKTRWTLDEKAKEVYIESAGEIRDFLSNYNTYLENTYDLQYEDDSFKGTYSDPKGGAEVHFIITEILVFPKSSDLSPFVFDESKIGKDWIITDLR